MSHQCTRCETTITGFSRLCDACKGKCRVCRTELTDINSYEGPSSYCRACHQVRCTEYRSIEVKRERKNLVNNQWYHRNSERIGEVKKVHRLANPALYLWKGAKNRALAKGLPFTIKVSDVVIPSHCPLLGTELFPSRGKPTDSSPSLDRVIPALGYVPHNIEVISHRANAIKNNATAEELAVIAEWVKNRSELARFGRRKKDPPQ